MTQHRSYHTKAGTLVWVEPTKGDQVLLRFRGEKEHTLTVTERHLDELVASGELSKVS